MRASRIERFLANLFLVVIAVGATCLGVEIASRFLFSESPVAIESGYDDWREPAPYVMFRAGAKAGDVNSLGYRGRDPTESRRPLEKRIFVLGGSTAYFGNPPLPEALERLIRERRGKVYKVFNFAIPSSKTGEELARLVHEVADLSPDIVIFYDGANDLIDPMGDPRPGYPFNFMTIEANPLLKEVNEYPLGALVAYGSNFLRHFFYWEFVEIFLGRARLAREAGYFGESWMRAAAKNYVRNIKKANRISQAFGAKFYAFFQPTKIFHDDANHGPAPKRLSREIYFSPLAGRELVRRELRAGDKLNFVDLSDMFNAYPAERVFPYDPAEDRWDLVHTKPELTFEIAEKIYEAIRKDL